MANETEVHRMAQSKDVMERKTALDELRNNFVFFIDKAQATKALLSLTKDESIDVRRSAAYALGSAFVHVIDKDQAWKALLSLTKDEDVGVQRDAVYALMGVRLRNFVGILLMFLDKNGFLHSLN